MGKRFVAYVRDGHDLLIRPARAERAWMDAHLDGHGYRCLPMRIANQHRWEIGSPVGFTAIWNGGPGQDCLAILPDEPSDRIRSHFGGGIFSFSDEPELAAALEDWTALRHDLRQALKDPDAPAARKRWPQQYRRGEDIRGRPAAPDTHRTQLRPRPFADHRTPAVPASEG